MKIYFSVSLSRMNGEIRNNCEKIVSHLKSLGHTVIPEEVLNKPSDAYIGQSPHQAMQEQKRLTKLKKMADLIVVEITNPSLGVGQEISLALSMNKPVIAFYHEKTAPHVLRDEGGDLLILSAYNDTNLVNVVEDSVEFAANHQDVRFNFFISPAIGTYLDWISQNYKIPRSVYLRNLIENDMNENKEYN